MNLQKIDAKFNVYSFLFSEVPPINFGVPYIVAGKVLDLVFNQNLKTLKNSWPIVLYVSLFVSVPCLECKCLEARTCLSCSSPIPYCLEQCLEHNRHSKSATF